MSEALFPTPGQYFGVTCADGIDRSYRSDVFICVASDQHRVVAKFITPSWGKDKPIIFHRHDWRIQGVDGSIVEAIYFPEEQVAASKTA